MRCTNEGFRRQIAQRRVAVCRLLVEEEAARSSTQRVPGRRVRCQSAGTDCTILPQRSRATGSVTEFYYAYLGDILAASRSRRRHAHERLDANAGVCLSTLLSVACLADLTRRGLSARRCRSPPRFDKCAHRAIVGLPVNAQRMRDRAGPSRKPGSASTRFCRPDPSAGEASMDGYFDFASCPDDRLRLGRRVAAGGRQTESTA